MCDVESWVILASPSELKHLVNACRMGGYAELGYVQILKQFDRDIGELFKDPKS